MKKKNKKDLYVNNFMIFCGFVCVEYIQIDKYYWALGTFIFVSICLISNFINYLKE